MVNNSNLIPLMNINIINKILDIVALNKWKSNINKVNKNYHKLFSSTSCYTNYITFSPIELSKYTCISKLKNGYRYNNKKYANYVFICCRDLKEIEYTDRSVRDFTRKIICELPRKYRYSSGMNHPEAFRSF